MTINTDQSFTAVYEVLASRRNADCIAREVHENEGPSSFPVFDILVRDLTRNRIVVAKVGLALDDRDHTVESGSPGISDEEMEKLFMSDSYDVLMLEMDRSQALVDANNAYHGETLTKVEDAHPTF